MKKLIESYNSTETALVITSYLAKSRCNFNAVSEYSERTLSYLARKRKVLVCAEKTGKNQEFSPGKNIFVVPIWEKGNPFSFISLFLFISRMSMIKSIYVQFEFNVFGGIIPNLALLLLLSILRFMGKQVTFELHQVIFDVGKLVKHVYITNFMAQKILNLGLRIYYYLLGISADHIIVFEDELKNRLVRYINPLKIHVLNLPTAKKYIISPIIAKRRLKLPPNKFIMMVFGFINGYKGIDWIIDAFSSFRNPQIRLLIVGGKNPYLKEQPSYQRFYNSIITKAKKNPGIIQRGFVPDDKVSLYYSAADLVIMPYEVFMSASGPFSLALSHNKPVILSEKLQDYSKSNDFSVAMKNAQLSHKDLFFELETAQFKQKITQIMKDKAYVQRLVVFSKTLNDLRSNEYFEMDLDKILFPQPAVKFARFISKPLLVKL